MNVYFSFLELVEEINSLITIIISGDSMIKNEEWKNNNLVSAKKM